MAYRHDAFHHEGLIPHDDDAPHPIMAVVYIGAAAIAVVASLALIMN